MYTEEERKSINWNNVFKKGLLIVIGALVIFLIIWLFTRNNSNAVNNNTPNNNGNINVSTDNNNNTNNGGITNPDVYSNVFIDDYRYFHDTAKEYFLISELPANGATIKYTLRELIQKGLILPFGYQNNETCDQEASYVTVTNLDGKYHMTVTLVCGREVAKTTEELGCNQLCFSGNCTIEIEDNTGKDSDKYDNIVEYQYRQPYTINETIYSCPSGYTKTGSGANTTCLKTNSTTTPTKKNVSYVCPSGYTEAGSGSSMKCVKTEAGSVDATKNVIYTCPSGYIKTGSGNDTKCMKTTEETLAASYDTIYSCPAGYTKTGSGANTKCTKTVTSYIEPTTGCPSGYTYSGGICTKTTTEYYDLYTSCPSGYTLSGSRCVRETTTTANPTYSCPSGYTLSGSKCTKTTTGASTNANVSYKCSKGTLEGTQCRTTTSTPYYESYERNYGKTYNGCTQVGTYTSPCDNGNKNCTKTYYKYECSRSSYTYTPATKVYTCSNGANPTSDGKCPGKTTTDTVNATAKCTTGTLVNGVCQITKTETASLETRCLVGVQVGGRCQVTNTVTASPDTSCRNGVKVGNQCQITDTVTEVPNARKDYYCKNGYTLDGTVCYKTISDTVKATETVDYTCQTGTLSGTKCLVNETETRNAIKSTTYTCEAGYTKIGIGPSSVCTKGETTSTSPTKGTKQVTKYRYKWSTETSLPGWDRTGETRTKTITSKEEEVIEK